ncbi:UvrD/REP helicase [Mesotoga infera]|jgi:ATP-dependent exoDNAse (exonuclease V) beta subunit|nr:UvrD/REP helicase [Mesotoga infera]
MNKDIFVTASAGTGKTFSLVKEYVGVFDRSFRIGERLDVHNVVAITFTNKAAREMKDRVITEIDHRIASGYPGSWKPLRNKMSYAWISTIHSFCERILRESALFAGIDPGFQILSGMRRATLEEKVVRTYFEDNLESLEPLIQLTGLDKAFRIVKEAISNKRHSLALNPSPVGSLLGDSIISDDEIIEGSKSFAAAYSEILSDYRDRTVRSGFLDFDQLLTETRDLLLKMPEVQEKYRDRFKFIFVDEFQDTDELQSEIIRLLREETKNRVFFVGDSKQSIYRFRGADVSVFNKTMKSFQNNGGELRNLRINRRSHPDLVTFQNKLFGKIMKRDFENEFFRSIYDEDIESLPYQRDIESSRVRIIRTESSDDSREVARSVRALIEEELVFKTKTGEYEKRRIVPGDIAILLRTFSKISSYENALEKLNIPFYTVGSRNFYERPEVSGLLSWLDLLVDPLDNNNLVSFLLSPAFGASLDEVLSLRSKRDLRRLPLYFALMESKEDRFAHLIDLLKKFGKLKYILSPSEILEKFVEETDYLPKLATLKSGERMIANVKKLLELAKDLDRMGSSLRELSSNIKAFIDSSDESEAALETEESDSVKILTVHKSKGLEFPIVIVGDTFWKKKNSDRRLFFHDGGFLISKSKPDREEGLIGSLASLEEEKEFEEEKRTLYVALSRAREMIIISLNGRSDSSRPWSKMICSSLLQPESDKVEASFEGIVKHFYPIDLPSIQETVYIEEPLLPEVTSVLPLTDSSYIKYLSPTSITADDEFELESESYAGSPGLVKNAADIGLLAHYLLEPVGVISKRGSVTTLESILNGGRPVSVDRINFNEYDLSEVKKVLSTLVAHPLIKEIEGAERVFSEFHFQHGFGKYVLMGIVDKLYLKDGKWRIVDFKFASLNKRFINKYRFQMNLYLYILKDLLSPIEATLLFLRDGKTEKIMLEDSDSFEKELLQMISKAGGGKNGS